MEKKIMKMLDEMKIPITHRGYHLWIELILYVYKTYKNKDILTINFSELCEKIADDHNLKYAAVERNLRYCVENRKNLIGKYFNYKDNITNKTFLILCVKKLKERN